MTGWLRNYIAYYATLAKPLQDRKTIILVLLPKLGDERRNFARKKIFGDPLELKKAVFALL